MPTFATGAPPGTYVRVLNQIVAAVVPPPFITALIGTTSVDKPVTKELTRDATIAGEETIRRDTLDTTVTEVTDVVDQLGIQHIENIDWVDTTPTATTYVEFAANATRATFNIPGIEILAFSGPTDTPSVADQPITSADGAQNLVWTNATTQLAWGGGSSVTVDVTATGLNKVYGITDTSSGTIRVKVIDPITLGAAGDGTDSVTLSTAGPEIALTYTVSYRKNKTTTDLEPQRFDDIVSVQEAHGVPTDPSSSPVTGTSTAASLSVASVPYFSAGGGSVYLVPLRDKSIDVANGWDIYNSDPAVADAAWVSAVAEALIQLENVAEVSNVVPLSPTERSATTGDFRAGIYNSVIAHLGTMNSLTTQRPRMAMLGARANTTNVNTFIESEQYGNNEYIVYLVNGALTLTTGGYTYTMNGSSAAAALAGICSRPYINAGEPISGKGFQYFTSITDPFTLVQKNRMGEVNGGTVIELSNGQPVVRHFLSTNPTSELTIEAKVAKIKIDIWRTLVQMLNAAVVNRRLQGQRTTALVRSLIGSILTQKITDGVINAYQDPVVTINATDSRQVDVAVSVQPTMDLNYVYIEATFVRSL